MATKQEIFDHVAKALLKQSRKSLGTIPGGGSGCRYRSGKLCCAVGHCIDDRDYDKKMEDVRVATLLKDFKFPHSPLLANSHVDVSLFESLQSVHDSSPVEEWREDLALVALRYGLSPAVLEA